MKKGLFVWGYVLDQVPGAIPFVTGSSHCSLETGVDYLGAESVIFMNSNHDIKTLDDKYLQHVAKCKEVICGLQPGLYAETAKEISRLSLTHKNIKGAVIDDFLDWHGPRAKMT